MIADQEVKVNPESIHAELRQLQQQVLRKQEELIRSTTREEKPSERIPVGKGRDKLVESVIGHLSRLGWDSDWVADENTRQRLKVYHRGGVLVEVLEGQHEASIRKIPASQLLLRIEEACLLVAGKDGGVVNAPEWLVGGVRTRGVFPGVRPLAGIVTAPTLRPDGSILQTPGYDPETGLVYRPGCEFPSVPENPTRADARAAAAQLLDVVADVEFVDDADRSAWLAQVLTMISREAIEGCCPMFATTANVRGSGKSLSVDTASMIALGRPAARKVYSANNEELRKVVTATALKGVPAVLFDNVDRPIGVSSLGAALTAETWTDRVLGSSATTGELPLRTVWAATGDNLRFGPDIARRVLPIRLTSSCERPEERTGFRHNPLLPWVKAERPRLAVAALTILRAYYVAGRPPQPGVSFGSFSAWSDLIRGAVVWAGLADPLLTREVAKDANVSRRVVSRLIAGLRELDPAGEGLTSRAIVERLGKSDAEAFPEMREAVGEIATRGGRIDAHRLGCALRTYKDRIADGFKLATRRNVANTTVWFAEPVARLRRESTPLDSTADDPLRVESERRPEVGRPAVERKVAVVWLADALADGPRPSKELFEEARGGGLSHRTLERAKGELGVVAYREAIPGPWLWRLPPVLPPA